MCSLPATLRHGSQANVGRGTQRYGNLMLPSFVAWAPHEKGFHRAGFIFHVANYVNSHKHNVGHRAQRSITPCFRSVCSLPATLRHGSQANVGRGTQRYGNLMLPSFVACAPHEKGFHGAGFACLCMPHADRSATLSSRVCWIPMRRPTALRRSMLSTGGSLMRTLT